MKFMYILFVILASCSAHLAPDYVIPVRNEPEIYPLVIIGSGAAGTMGVKRAVLNNNEVLLFLGAKQERRRSRGNWVRKVDNVPGLERYDRPILELRNETLTEIYQGPFSSNLYAVEDSVVQIEKDGNLFKLTDGAGHVYYGQHVLLATGIMDEQPNIQGSIRPILDFSNGQTVAYCLVCDGHRSLDKNTVVLGYSEEAASGALLLFEKYHPPSLAIITNGNTPEFSRDTQVKLNQNYIAVYTSAIQDVLGDRSTKQLEGFQLESGETIPAEMGFVMLGIRPNNQLAIQLGVNVDSRGLVLTDPSGESSVPNLFIAGDLRSGSMKQIYTAWQHSVECIQTINARLRTQEAPLK
jgi:thioredoxin reductase (NADPH)